MKIRSPIIGLVAALVLYAGAAFGGLVPSDNARTQTVESDTTLNVEGTLQIDGTTVTASAAELNLADGATLDTNGAKNGSCVTAAEVGLGAVHKTVLTLAACSITVTDTGGANGAQGSTKIYDFPAGVIVTHGCVANLTTTAGAGGIADGAALVGSLGTTAAAAGNATLTTTEADWIASYAGTLSSGAGVITKYGEPSVTSWDGHTTAVDLYLNVAVPDADVSASDTLTVAGTITCNWSNSGDF